MDYSKVWSLFSNRYKYETWLNIEKEIIKFFNLKGFVDDVSLRRIEYDLDSNVFEILSNLDLETSDFDRFVDFVFSKSACLKRFYSISALSRFNFEDTFNSIVLKKCNDFLLDKLNEFQNKLKRLSNKYKSFVQIGRTHGVHAEPISFGCKFVSCWCDMKRVIEDFWNFRKNLEVVTLDCDSLYVPTLSDELQKHLSEAFDLNFEAGNFNVFPKERYSQYLLILSSISGILNKFSLDLYFASYDGVDEVKLSGELGLSYEKIELSSKLINLHSLSFFDLTGGYSEDSGLFCEKERIYIFDSIKYLLVLIRELNNILDGMEVLEENMQRNLELSKKSIFSQAVMLHVLKNGKFTRQEVLEDMKVLCSRITDGTQGFYREILNSPKYGDMFTNESMDQIFSSKSHFLYMDHIYKRAFKMNDNMPFLYDSIWGESEISYVLDKLSEQINYEYRSVVQPVTVIAFSKRSLVMLGVLMTRFNFPIRTIIFGLDEENSDIKSLTFDHDFIGGTRVLILDYMVSNENNLSSFIDKFREYVVVKDVMVCSLLKTKDFDKHRYQVDWWGFECDPGREYSGFGKAITSRDNFAQLPKIGFSS